MSMNPLSLWRGWRREQILRSRGVPIEVLRRTGPRFTCGPGAFFRPGEDIQIGANVFFGRNIHISAPCIIKSDVLLASYVALVGGDHSFDRPGKLINQQGRGDIKPIIIEEDAWVGHGSIILTGVRIGRGAIIAGGSVITKDIPPCTIWGSPPGRYIRDRFPSAEEQQQHLSFLEERYGPAGEPEPAMRRQHT